MIVTTTEKEKINQSGNRLIKEVVIARSGLYEYGISEINALQLNHVPEQFKSLTAVNVYRPAIVLEKCKDMFMCLPVTILHPKNNIVRPDMAKAVQEGLTGEIVEITYDDNGEALVKTTITLTTESAIKIYERGYKEVSPGYNAIFEWLDKPQEYKGQEYHIIMKDMIDVTHLALVPVGRGGQRVRIVDHAKEVKTMFVTNLFYKLAKKASGVGDSSSIKDTLTRATGDAAQKCIEEIQGAISYLPESEGKTKLNHYLTDFLAVGDNAPELKSEAINEIVGLYEKLDAEATGDSKADDTMSAAEDKKDEKKPGEEEKKTGDSSDDDKEKKTGDMNPGTTAAAGAGASTLKEKSTGDAAQIAAATAAAFFAEMGKLGMFNVPTATGDGFQPTATLSGETKQQESAQDYLNNIGG